MAVSREDKMRIQTLREQGLGAKAIRAAYPQKRWKISTLKKMCQRIDKTGSVVERKVGSGRPKSARSTANIDMVQELISVQEYEPGTSRSTVPIAGEIDISATSVRRIAKVDLGLSSFRRMTVQVVNEATRLKRLMRCKRLMRRLTIKVKKVFSTDKKLFYVSPPVNNQNDRAWSAGRKMDVNPQRFLVQRAKFKKRSSTRVHQPRDSVVQKQTPGVRQSLRRSLRAPTVASNILRIVITNRHV